MGEISVEDLNGFYRELADEFDLETVIKIHELYSGIQITFPQNLVSKESLHRRVIEEYNGNNARQLAKKYGYTERWVKKIISCS